MSELGPERWRKIGPILEQALELPPPERAAYLDRACAGDDDLRRDVQSFLDAEANAEGALAAPTEQFLARFADAGEKTAHVDPPPPGEAAPGFERIGNYRILRELGAGGMGTVYEARDEKMHRDVALKVMSRHHAPSAKVDQRFAQEAWIAGRLSHPNIVKVYERGDWQELHFFSMELVRGGSLHDVIENLKADGKDETLGLTFGSRDYVQWAITQIVAVARGLAYAHEQGIVHRDIKPMNLLISRQLGSVKIADFGLAVAEDATRLTTEGKALGTPFYMSPEQIMGRQEETDARSDVYALGVTLFELLTLKLPYSGDSGQLYLQSVLTSEPQKAGKLNEQVSRDLETVIGKALEKRPLDRYASATAFADDLDNVLNFRPIAATPAGAPTRALKWVRRKPMHALVAAILLVATPTLAILGQRELSHRATARAEKLDELVREVRWLSDGRRYREALERLEQLLQIDRSHAMGLTHRALARMHLSNETEDDATVERLRAGALADIERVIDAEPNLSWPHLVRARILEEFDRTAEADEETEVARSLRAGEPSPLELYYEARLAMDARDYPRAIEFNTSLQRHDPGNTDAIHSRGMAHDYLGDFDAASIEYRVAIGINPNLDLPLIDLARLYVDAGRLDEAHSFLERALELDPRSAVAFEVLSYQRIELARRVAYDDQDRPKAVRLLVEAEEAARSSLELEPDRPWSLVNLGWALTDRFRASEPADRELLLEAAASFESAINLWEHPPTSGVDLDVYARASANQCDVLIELGKLEEALPSCKRVTELLPDNPVPYYNLAGVHALSGRRDEAFEALERNFELGDRDWQYLTQDRWFASLRNDLRFERLVARMKAETP